ncbi:hypothetical protein CH352_04655 [Leptospira hartskeerlii]|uniref:Uncharacterized protein n=1 Tax=Leptospira hartskeerlii TaxID=2023177 RepID=A0A2M9XG45_9LEPT|nr:hypothetical protein CH357_03800 [Leptospira hartskeerlii]PJZ34890.1 hypothetical protein CH352_04655 [Leptospira hartskeerlii]
MKQVIKKAKDEMKEFQKASMCISREYIIMELRQICVRQTCQESKRRQAQPYKIDKNQNVITSVGILRKIRRIK